MGNPVDVAFVGAMVAPLVLPFVIIMWCISRSGRAAAMVIAVGVSLQVLLLAHWVLWLNSFDQVGGEPVPNALFPVVGQIAQVAVCGAVLFAALAMVSISVHKRSLFRTA